MSRYTSDKPSKTRIVLVGIWLAVVFLLITLTFYFWQVVNSPNIAVKDDKTFLYIPTGANINTVVDSLKKKDLLIDEVSFRFLARTIGYNEKVKPGKYLVENNFTNKELIMRLIRGEQTPVKFTFNSMRLKSDFAKRISENLEIDYDTILNLLNNEEFASQYGFNKENFLCMFIPNTYEFYWNTSAKRFFDRMNTEYKKFWTPERLAKADSIGLKLDEVIIMASIVDAETNMTAEMPRVSGVYMNRLKINHPLQADPTLVFAVGDFTIKRVRKGHREVDSPYNTYMYKGLPPGPINIPSIKAIDAVLNTEKHEYFFFCANPDLSGNHIFTKNFNDHLKVARNYQKELNVNNIQ
jgi:UPF0755 protein